MRKAWYEYLWIASLLYLILGFFNILFAWLGLICFLVPLALSIFGKGKVYCNRYCGRGQLFQLLGGKYKVSRNQKPPKFLASPWFRNGFLTFFMIMFMVMLYTTYLVFQGKNVKEVVTLLWVFKLPWNFASVLEVTPWVAQFAFGLYSIMLTSTILGLITMMLYRPRSWCAYCPMGSMTQMICKVKEKA